MSKLNTPQRLEMQPTDPALMQAFFFLGQISGRVGSYSLRVEQAHARAKSLMPIHLSHAKPEKIKAFRDAFNDLLDKLEAHEQG